MKTAFNFIKCSLACIFVALVISCGENSQKTKENANESFRNALSENLSDVATTNKNAEQELKRAEEAKERNKIIEDLQGTWVYQGPYNGYNITSELRFTESTMEWYINGEEVYRGRWDFDWDSYSEDWLILYNPVSSTNWSDILVYDPIKGIEFVEGRYYKKSNRRLNYGQTSNSARTTFRSDYDVYSYLSSHSFRGGNVTVSFGNGGSVMYANGNQLSNAMVVSSFNTQSAILSYTSPFSPGTHYIRIDNKSGTLTDGDGNVYYSR